MGLDMYLTKKSYVKNWNHRPDSEKFEITVNKGGNPFDVIRPERISYIEEEVGYWRKANHIHNWFVENVQDGNDDCKEYYVGTDDLLNLLETCKRVKEDNSLAESLLPTKSGFFFGDTTYDEYYYQDIDTTIQIIETLLSEKVKDEAGRESYTGDIYYTSSW